MSSPATRHTENVSLFDTLACSIVLHAYLRRGCSGWLRALSFLFDVHPLILVKLLAPLEEGLDASTAVTPGGGLTREVLEGLCQRGDGL